jgi:AcrR family transcriptional regulator
MAHSDRRVRRTRNALRHAFLSLVLDKSYESITVQDILDRADVGRSTFYMHFRDKEALLLACFDEMAEQLRSAIDTRGSTGQSIDPAGPAGLVFEHAYENRRAYRALCGNTGGQVVQTYLHRLIGELLAENLRPQPAARGAEQHAEVAAEFYTAATMGLLRWWVDHDFCHGPAWLATRYRKLATMGTSTA